MASAAKSIKHDALGGEGRSFNPDAAEANESAAAAHEITSLSDGIGLDDVCSRRRRSEFGFRAERVESVWHKTKVLVGWTPNTNTNGAVCSGVRASRVLHYEKFSLFLRVGPY